MKGNKKMNLVQPIKSADDLKKMENWLKNYNYMYYTIFMIGIYSGLRISDILNLKVNDVKEKDKITVREKKTGKRKEFPLQDIVIKTIETYLNKRNDKFVYADYEDYLFIGKKGCRMCRSQVYRILNTAAAECDLNIDVGTHTMRKTFAYHMYKQSNDIVLVQRLLNHSSPSITLRYIGIEQEELNKAYKTLDFSKKVKQKPAKQEILNTDEIMNKLNKIENKLNNFRSKLNKLEVNKSVNKTVEFLLNYLNSGGVKYREFAELALQGG